MPNSAESSPSSLTENQVGVLNRSGTAINQSITDNGTTVALKAVVCDESNAYLLLDVTAPKETKLNRNDYGFERTLFKIKFNDTHSSSGGQEFLNLKDDNPNDNQKSFVLHIYHYGSDLRGLKLQLTLENLSTVREEKAENYYTHVVEGTWTFDPITLQSTADTKELTAGKTTHFMVWHGDDYVSDQCTVDSVNLSPFSAVVYFTGKKMESKGDCFAVPHSLTATMKDGTKIAVSHPGGGNCHEGEKDAKAYYSWTFDSPIDVGQVASLTIGDLTIPVS